MRIAERRVLVEILLCGLDIGCMSAAWHLDFDRSFGLKAGKERNKVMWEPGWRFIAANTFASAGLEAAYRLIESSPTLVREYFGREPSP